MIGLAQRFPNRVLQYTRGIVSTSYGCTAHNKLFKIYRVFFFYLSCCSQQGTAAEYDPNKYKGHCQTKV